MRYVVASRGIDSCTTLRTDNECPVEGVAAATAAVCRIARIQCHVETLLISLRVRGQRSHEGRPCRMRHRSCAVDGTGPRRSRRSTTMCEDCKDRPVDVGEESMISHKMFPTANATMFEAYAGFDKRELRVTLCDGLCTATPITLASSCSLATAQSFANLRLSTHQGRVSLSRTFTNNLSTPCFVLENESLQSGLKNMLARRSVGLSRRSLAACLSIGTPVEKRNGRRNIT